jgi:hypothetical protein
MYASHLPVKFSQMHSSGDTVTKHTTVSVTKGVGVQPRGARLDDRRRDIDAGGLEERRKDNSGRKGVVRTALARSCTGRVMFMLNNSKYWNFNGSLVF